MALIPPHTSIYLVFDFTTKNFLPPRPIIFHTGAAVDVAAPHCGLVFRSMTCQSPVQAVASPAGLPPSPAGPVHQHRSK